MINRLCKIRRTQVKQATTIVLSLCFFAAWPAQISTAGSTASTSYWNSSNGNSGKTGDCTDSISLFL